MGYTMGSGKRQRVSRVGSDWLAAFVCMGALTLHAQMSSLHGSPRNAADEARTTLLAEDGSAGWLRYAPITDASMYEALSPRIAIQGDSVELRTAAAELQRGLSSMLRRRFVMATASNSQSRDAGNAIVIGAGEMDASQIHAIGARIHDEAYRIKPVKDASGRQRIVIVGSTPRCAPADYIEFGPNSGVTPQWATGRPPLLRLLCAVVYSPRRTARF